MLYSIILDTDTRSVCVYKEYDLFRSIPIDLYRDLSIDNLIDLGSQTLKKLWRKDL